MVAEFPLVKIKGRLVEYKTVSFLVKSIDQKQGIVTGLASPMLNVDRQKDQVEPGAYTKTLSEAQARMENGRRFMCPTLWMHNPEQPTGGVISGEEIPEGLQVTMKYDISTNSAGIPNNPIATMVFSGMDVGYIDELSIGYIAIKYDYDKQGVRHLREIQLIEISSVTMLFAANPEALVPASGVKSMQLQQKGAASGKTSWTLADRATKWDSGQATKDIEAWANGDWSKVAQCFFWVAENPPKTLDDCKLPFVAKDGGTMKAIPQGIISCAGVIQGAMGGVDLGDDEDAVKKKIATYYKKMDMTPPWEAKGDDDKRSAMTLQRKDFDSLFAATQAADCLEDLADLLNTFTQATIQAFGMGDEPQQDMSAVLEQFSAAIGAWTTDAMACNLKDYLAQRGYCSDGTPYVPYSMRVGGYDYSTRHDDIEGKVGATISGATRGTLEQHQADMQKSLGTVMGQCKAMQEKVGQLTALWKQNQEDDQQEQDDGKALARREPPPALSRTSQQPLSQKSTDAITIDELAELLA